MTDRDHAGLFLVGFMGSGKSTVAALIATRSARRLIDLDARIVSSAGQSIAALLGGEGEEEFRRIERAVLQEIRTDGAVVATGGGTFLQADNRAWMRRFGVSVWLDVCLGEARGRTAGGSGRPLWRDDDPIGFRALFERRRAVYALADLRVLTSQKTPENVAIEVFERFERFFD